MTLSVERIVSARARADMPHAARIIYRGPWQSRRIQFVLDAIAPLGNIDMYWLCPQGITSEQREIGRNAVRGDRGDVLSEISLVDGRALVMPLMRLLLARELRGLRADVSIVAIGLTAKAYLPNGLENRLVWLIQGVPEEAVVARPGVKSRLKSEGTWWAAGKGPAPEHAVVVSKRMKVIVESRLSLRSVQVIPNTVRTGVFRRPVAAPDRTYDFLYLGSGAAWQGVPDLCNVWRELAALRPKARFLVVSKDARCASLLDAVSGKGKCVSRSSPAEVARELWTSRIGFLLRADVVANRVSCPVKFGEYVAAGVSVVTTDIDWDIGDIVRSCACGVALRPSLSPRAIAEAIIAYDEAPRDVDEGTTEAAMIFDNERWLPTLRELVVQAR